MTQIRHVVGGSLTIVGTGISAIAHITAEAQAWIARADQTFFLVPHPLAEEWLQRLNPRAESLARFYAPQRERLEVYQDITAHVLAAVRAGQVVCAAFYGHPCVFVTPTHDMIRIARAEGYPVTVLPGISAEDCLFADLDLDPGRQGCQTYEASDFLFRPRRFDPATPLILWQVGVTGYFDVIDSTTDCARGIALLEALLLRFYPQDHEVILYQAAMLPTDNPIITPLPLDQLHNTRITAVATLYVPPVALPAIDPSIHDQFGSIPFR